jgi:hypothetical protein
MPTARISGCLAILLVALAVPVHAAGNEPPSVAIRFLYQSRPETGLLSEAWRRAEKALVYAAMMNGDYAGAERAHAFIAQQALRPVLASLANAELAIEVRDSVGAARSLATANAFFPYGRMGRFGYDASGNVWGQELNAADSSSTVGNPFRITSEMVLNLLSAERAGAGR